MLSLSCSASVITPRTSAFKRWTSSLAVNAWNETYGSQGYKYYQINEFHNLPVVTCKCGAMCLIKGFEANSVSSSISNLCPDVIKRAIQSSFASDKDATRSIFLCCTFLKAFKPGIYDAILRIIMWKDSGKTCYQTLLSSINLSILNLITNFSTFKIIYTLNRI